MTKESADISRRTLLGVAVVGGGAALAGVSFSAAEAAGKVSQQSVDYRGSPKGKARCSNCVQWQPPAACKLVSGKINPNGWCSIYAPAKA